MESSTSTLPADVLHLIAMELAARRDFGTLFNCTVSSKQFAQSGAINALYRISHESPLRDDTNDFATLAEQFLMTMKRAILWRSIMLSAIGEAMYPYSRHLRMLDLRDLYTCLENIEEAKNPGKIEKHLFAEPLSRFRHVVKRAGRSRLDPKKIVLAVGDVIVKSCPLLEVVPEPYELSGVLATVLPTWVTNLPHLRELELFDGGTLRDKHLRSLLHTHCPKLDRLRIHHFNEAGDETLAEFFNGMPPNTLRHFENVSKSGISVATIDALNRHNDSLVQLKLLLEPDGILALGLFETLPHLVVLELNADTSSGIASPDLKATEPETYLKMTSWLKTCVALQNLTFTNMISAPDLALATLIAPDIKLRSLHIHVDRSAELSLYPIGDHHDFHRALGQHISLENLHLYANPEPSLRDDIDTVVDQICALRNLQELKLVRISDYFTNQQLRVLTQHLKDLEELDVGGYGISDAALVEIPELKKLRHLTFSGFTSFTEHGLLNCIRQFGQSNCGLVLSVEMAEPESLLSPDAEENIRSLMSSLLDGKFEYVPSRDPNIPEFDQSDSSS